MRRQELKSDGPVEFGVLGPVHDTHPSFTELPGDAVVRDGLADHDTPILARFRYVMITTDVMNDDIFSSSGA